MQMIPQMMPQMMPHGGMHPMMFSNGGMPQMMPTMPPMVPTAESDSESSHEQPAAAPATAAPSSSAAGAPPPSNTSNQSHDVPEQSFGFSDAMKQRISRSMTYVRQLPRWFIQEVVEFLNPNFDATLVADLSQHGLLSLLFLFCRIKPNVRVSELRSLVPIIMAKTKVSWVEVDNVYLLGNMIVDKVCLKSVSHCIHG